MLDAEQKPWILSGQWNLRFGSMESDACSVGRARTAGRRKRNVVNYFVLVDVNWIFFLLCLYISGRILCGMEEVYRFIYLPSWLSVSCSKCLLYYMRLFVNSRQTAIRAV
ncbi:hypothetical protein GGI42DRAFT_313591 [Trichoderma sp. SZMC 28013]